MIVLQTKMKSSRETLSIPTSYLAVPFFVCFVDHHPCIIFLSGIRQDLEEYVERYNESVQSEFGQVNYTRHIIVTHSFMIFYNNLIY